jgi:hypothetical protein
MIQVRVSGSYNPSPYDYDGMHSFQSRSTDGFGGRMDTKVNAALRNFYKVNKLNPSISAINVIMDDTKWVVKWEVLIEESKDGKAYVGLTSRGGAGSITYVDGPYGAPGQYKKKAEGLKNELSDSKLEVKQVYDFIFTPKPGKVKKVRQIFGIYTNPKRYPPYPPSTPQPASSTIIDSNTNQPIQGAQTQIDSNTNQPTPGNQTQIERLLKEKGLDINDYNSIYNIYLPVTTDFEQNTSLEPQLEIPPAPTSSKPEDLPKVLISAPGYESVEVVPYKGDGTIKTDLGVIPLTSTNVALEQDKIKASQLTTDQIKELSKGDKGIDYYTQERLSNQVNTLKSTLIPIVLTLIAGFGITKASDLVAQNKDKISDAIENKSNCPTQLELISIINRKNKLVKQLNNSLKIIDSTTKTLAVSATLIELTNALIQFQSTNPTPVSTGVPGVPGLPIGLITAADDSKDNNKLLLEKLRKINSGTLTILVLLRGVLEQAVQLLNLLDKLVQKCYPEADQEQISAELTALTTQQSVQLSPVVTNVNGFEMGVETEPTTNSLKRRRAIAQNKQNVVMLKGEWSFSSIDQILIDELVFYIQQNNLKAD